ncbi:MAG: hypothetical protein M2R45_03016 [Verrucomicrobia subdivision 3 bacterium]|nr:hypothetical protein [Limisphaerales bacterium]MCS1415536.1 hypothetical protein [Limisphaerales bacterium]
MDYISFTLEEPWLLPGGVLLWAVTEVQRDGLILVVRLAVKALIELRPEESR